MCTDKDPDRCPGRTDLIWIKKEYILKIVVELARMLYGGYTRFMLSVESTDDTQLA